MADRVRVLSIDGGGIRGIIPALVLGDLERRTGRPVADLFDLIAGTSTGGILALALAQPGTDGRPARTAEQLARATAAAPTYFEPLALTLGGRERSLIDGGVFATNPAMLAYAEVARTHPRPM